MKTFRGFPQCSLLFALSVAFVSVGITGVYAREAPTQILLPIKTDGAPALDLSYQNRGIDVGEAIDLQRKGIDLSTLDPLPSDSWQPTSLPLSNAENFVFPPEGATVHFLNDIAPNGMYRGQVEYGERPFRLIVDMDGRQSLMMAALLRKLGYPVDSPKAYRELSLQFDTAEEMQNFVDTFAEEPGFPATKPWLKNADQAKLKVTLQDVNLEGPRLNVAQLYTGKVDPSWIAGHRAMRALIIPLMLLDVRLSEISVNIFPWEFSRIFSESIVLSHESAAAFNETTYEDARWIARKIAFLPKEELRTIIAHAGYPSDIASLLVEKVSARRNQLVDLFDLKRELPADLRKLPYKSNLTVGTVVKGEATQERYPDYAARFTVPDPESPLRWSELKPYLKMEAIAQGIRALTERANKELQFINTTDGLEAHKQNYLDAILDHFKAHPNDPYVVPLKPWVQPLVGLNFNASRSLVTGTYYGSDSQAQLVDNLVVGANVGGFGGIDGRTYLQNVGFGGSVAYQRTYTHVRPIETLQAVKNESWKKLYVPGFLKSTGKVLAWKKVHARYTSFKGAYAQAQRQWIKDYPKLYPIYEKQLAEYQKTRATVCASQGYPEPYTDCALDAEKYPAPIDPTPDPAKIFQKEIGGDVPPGRDLPPVSHDSRKLNRLPPDLEDTVVSATLREFLSDVRDDEVYTITDSLVNQASVQVQIPVTTLAGMGVVDLIGANLYKELSPAVGVSLSGQWAILKRLMFMRKGDQLTAYDTKMNTRAFGAGTNFSAWIEMAKLSMNRKGGGASTDALMLDLSVVTDEEKVKDPKRAPERLKLMRSISDLLVKNEIDRAEELSPSYDLQHSLKGRQRGARILPWNWTTYAETHLVTVTPPSDPTERFNRNDIARTLYSARKMNLRGKNPYGLLGQVLSKAVGVNGLLDPNASQNPSGTFLGSSNWNQVRAEAEVTRGREFRPVLILEENYSGWFLAKEKLLKILDRIEARVKTFGQSRAQARDTESKLDRPLFRRDMFASTTQLQTYVIRSNLVIYPSGVDRIEKILFTPKTRRELILALIDLAPEDDLRKRCQKYLAELGIEAELESLEKVEARGKITNRCIQPWMRTVMRHVRNAPPREKKEKYTEWLSTSMYHLNKNIDLSRLLNRVGSENFFYKTVVSGFRKGDEAAKDKDDQTDYISDSIGTDHSQITQGPFGDFTVYSHATEADGRRIEWKISDYELQARYFGDGL